MGGETAPAEGEVAPASADAVAEGAAEGAVAEVSSDAAAAGEAVSAEAVSASEEVKPEVVVVEEEIEYEEYWEEFGEDEWIPDPNEPVRQPEHPAEFINVRVQNNMDGTSTVYYTPKWIGEYQISLYYAETEIKNSPFNCDIIKNPTP